MHSSTHHLKDQRLSATLGDGVKSPNLILDNNRIQVYQKQLGQWDNLNHLIVCRKTKKACIVDPFDGIFWEKFCQENSIIIEEIWLTHSHWDHCKGVEELVNSTVFSPVVRCHELEQQRGYNGKYIQWWNHNEHSSESSIIGGLEFSIHCAPGHTPGHVVIIGNGIVISGDCLFLGSCGRTDLLGGDTGKQRASLKYLQTIFSKLSGSDLVVPGHKYELKDGTTPTVMKLSKVIASNEALMAVEDDDRWESLPFLAFDDDLAERARRQKAQQS